MAQLQDLEEHLHALVRQKDVSQQLSRPDQHRRADGDGLLVRLGAKAVHEVPTYLALGVPGLGQEGYVLRDY